MYRTKFRDREVLGGGSSGGGAWSGPPTPETTHFTAGEGQRATLSRAQLIHLTWGEGLRGGEGHPHRGSRNRSISRLGRVAPGEGSWSARKHTHARCRRRRYT